MPGEQSSEGRLSDKLAPLASQLLDALKQDGMDGATVMLAVALHGDVSGVTGSFGSVRCQKAMLSQLLLSIDRSIENLAKATNVDPQVIILELRQLMRKQPDYLHSRFFNLDKDPDAG